MQNISSFIPIFTSINLHKKCGYKISTQGKEKKDVRLFFRNGPELYHKTLYLNFIRSVYKLS